MTPAVDHASTFASLKEFIFRVKSINLVGMTVQKVPFSNLSNLSENRPDLRG